MVTRLLSLSVGRTGREWYSVLASESVVYEFEYRGRQVDAPPRVSDSLTGQLHWVTRGSVLQLVIGLLSEYYGTKRPFYLLYHNLQ